MQLVNELGELTSFGQWLAGILLRAKGRQSARVARQIVKEYGKAHAATFIEAALQRDNWREAD